MNKLRDILEGAGFKLRDDQLKAFRLYLAELQRWNKTHNLTAVREEEEIVKKHFLDSLTLARCFEDLGVEWRGKEVLDVGSGAGFPGVPLKIYLGDLHLFLAESTNKKCAFLEILKVHLHLEWTVLCMRAEKIKRRFPIVVARALGEFEKIVPMLESLSSGYVFVMKGKEVRESWEKELGYGVWKVRVKGLPERNILWKRLL
ncbi:MAG TPA: 16S rRNA (guanine(527)-N(7))-methyltransferase RsmG [Aquifex aeolicus]|nr:16S rRNA (guanine(527)-N(7))-methyltransferase RsmG [Aquifex aeolicus]